MYNFTNKTMNGATINFPKPKYGTLEANYIMMFRLQNNKNKAGDMSGESAEKSPKTRNNRTKYCQLSQEEERV